MFFGTNRSLQRVNLDKHLFLNNNPIELVQKFKYLGIILDSELNYDKYISDIRKKVGFRITQLSRIRKYINSEQALNIYKTKVLPFFDYGDVLYHGSAVQNTDKLRRLQNRALKVCLMKGRLTSTNLIHKEAKINFLEERRISHVLKLSFKKAQKQENLQTKVRNTRHNEGPLLKYI